MTVYRDRYVTVDPKSVEAERTGFVYPPTISDRDLDKHDAAAMQALARANGKLHALRCAGIAGVDGTTAAECLTPSPVTEKPP